MEPIPDKRYFRIGEVSKISGVEPYILRYWETEFEEIRPPRSNKQRLYRKKDVELILRIKQLLYDEKFTISGAKQKIKEERSKQLSMPFMEDSSERLLKEIREELLEIKEMLDREK
jgi:DNA-binding transcriptional MerR regulator